VSTSRAVSIHGSFKARLRDLVALQQRSLRLTASGLAIQAGACSFAAVDAAYVNRMRLDGPGGVAAAVRVGAGSMEREDDPTGGIDLGGRVQMVSGEPTNPRLGAGPSVFVAHRFEPSIWGLGGRAGVWFDGPSELRRRDWIAPAVDLMAVRWMGERQALLLGVRAEWHARPSPFDATGFWGITVGYAASREKAPDRGPPRWSPFGGGR
jgi:hypothetical protein